ncbi:hypothetical protein DJ013_18000 [Arcticibacterium luteifluviistationis]|uniref:Ig-like domain-containing protein n=2 Tax=Arcticibacterium luteifluviistationis TaxID=1784714 RepID=A0A2Z4GFE7_9BACT|nr:hypothetical protein DJ013_18000 [Arcticibacterium luteifluviistationis]
MHANYWLFGSNAGMYFPMGENPGVSTSNNMNTEKASMTHADAKGNLVLYSNGSRVWNANGNVVPGAENLIRAFDPSYPGLIVPIPEREDEFYIFSVDDFTGNNNPGTVSFPIFYSLIDLKGNAGEGQKIGETKMLLENSSYGLTTVKHCNNIDYWLILHSGEGNTFYSYLISKDGIQTDEPIESQLGIVFSGSSLGLPQEIIASQDGKKIAVTKPAHPEDGFLEVFSFDNRTGKVTSSLTSYNALKKIKGAAFSPNGALIYVSLYVNQRSQANNGLANDYELVQFRASYAPAYKRLITEKTFTGQSQQGLGDFLVEPGSFGNIKLGPNGKIYLAHIDDNFLSVINNPNGEGNGSNFSYRDFSLNGKFGKAQLPNTVSPSYKIPEAKLAFQPDSLACNPTLKVEVTNSDNTIFTYQWLRDGLAIDGANSEFLKIRETGNYEVEVMDNCQEVLSNNKTISITIEVPPPVNDAIFTYCQGAEIAPLEADGTNLKWYNDEALSNVISNNRTLTPNIDANSVGIKTFYVTKTISGCESIAAKYEIDIEQKEQVEFVNESLSPCFDSGFNIQLRLKDEPSSNINWFFNNTLVSNTKTFAADSYGTYVAQIGEGTCFSSDTIQVRDGCFRIFLPTAFSPNGDGINESLDLIANGNFTFDYQIIDRKGTIMAAQREQKYPGNRVQLWDGNYNGVPAPIGIYQYFLNARFDDEGGTTIKNQNGKISLLR